MQTDFNQVQVSVVMLHSDRLPYDRPSLLQDVTAALQQDHEGIEILIAAEQDSASGLEAEIGGLPGAKRVRCVPGAYTNRAAMYNAAIRAAKGAFVLLVSNERARVTLRRSAVRTMIMAATRHDAAGMVYADYDLIDAAGNRKEIHLLDWHEGRLRDTFDFGPAILYPVAVLRRIGGLNEKYNVADLYDLRLRATEQHPAMHIANRFAGSLYSVAAPAKAHNVFDYLLADKAGQLEMEDALTAHLKRTGSYLAPGAHVGKISYSAEERTAHKTCMASVVIPVNNRPEFIGRAIESVQAQTVEQVEVIVVVNGGESDPTADVVRRYMKGGDLHNVTAPPVRLIVVDINNLGLCLNSGIAAARGKFYVQLDSDDRLKPDAVEKLLAVFDADPTVGMVIGSYEVWNLDEKTGELARNEAVPVVTHDEWTADNGRNNLLRINGAGAPRAAHVKAIREAGWFGVNDVPSCRNYGEDYDLVLRISERYTIGRVWEPIYDVIRHAGGTDHSIDQATIDRNDNAKDHMRLEAIQRRRRLNQQGE